MWNARPTTNPGPSPPPPNGRYRSPAPVCSRFGTSWEVRHYDYHYHQLRCDVVEGMHLLGGEGRGAGGWWHYHQHPILGQLSQEPGLSGRNAILLTVALSIPSRRFAVGKCPVSQRSRVFGMRLSSQFTVLEPHVGELRSVAGIQHVWTRACRGDTMGGSANRNRHHICKRTPHAMLRAMECGGCSY